MLLWCNLNLGKKINTLSRPEIKPWKWGGQLLIARIIIPPVSFLDVSITKQVLILEQQWKRKQLDFHEMEMIFTVMWLFCFNLLSPLSFYPCPSFWQCYFPPVTGSLYLPKHKSFSWIKMLPEFILTLT